MKRGISWLESVSPREQKRRAEAYKKRMFPFGDAQKQRELDALRSCITTSIEDSQLLYQLVCVKEWMQEPEEIQEEAKRQWERSPLASMLTGEERRALCVLAELESRCDCLEEFPQGSELKKYLGTGRMP